jgi:hypothetical protein
VRKGLIAYHKANGIIAMKKHVEIEHVILFVKNLKNVTNQCKTTYDKKIKLIRGPTLHP